MLVNKTLGLVLAGSLILAGSALLVSQGTATPQESQEKKLKKVPITHSDPTSGKQMYMDYCAACHGMDGKGNGPATEFLKAPPADLTMLAKGNNGKFPTAHFAAVLRFGEGTQAHGTSDMPLWGPLFRSQNITVAELRIHNLTSFVESIQEK
jgi:mono/diheme cytochrome c family protein